MHQSGWNFFHDILGYSLTNLGLASMKILKKFSTCVKECNPNNVCRIFQNFQVFRAFFFLNFVDQALTSPQKNHGPGGQPPFSPPSAEAWIRVLPKKYPRYLKTLKTRWRLQVLIMEIMELEKNGFIWIEHLQRSLIKWMVCNSECNCFQFE